MFACSFNANVIVFSINVNSFACFKVHFSLYFPIFAWHVSRTNIHTTGRYNILMQNRTSTWIILKPNNVYKSRVNAMSNETFSINKFQNLWPKYFTDRFLHKSRVSLRERFVRHCHLVYVGWSILRGCKFYHLAASP